MKDAHLQAAAPRHHSLALRKSPQLGRRARAHARVKESSSSVWDTNLVRTHDRPRTSTCAVKVSEVWVGGAESTG